MDAGTASFRFRNIRQLLILAPADPFPGPGSVLGDQFVRILGGAFQGRQVALISYISERDTNIAEETSSLDAFDG